MKIKVVMIACVAILAVSCVSSKKYKTLNAELMRVDSQRARAMVSIDNLQVERNKLESDLNRTTAENKELGEKYQKLQNDYQRLLADNSAEAARLLSEITHTQKLLAEREKMLKSQQEALSAIRKKVADALLGFEGKGLTVTQRGENVYVSMDDKLLFRSGSFDIDPQGAKAVIELAVVLAQNPDINIMVEGHTDNVPYKSNGQLKDNLDLSAKRATTVTRLLLVNRGIDPARITSAARGESLPLDKTNTSEARQKNRRTEIILTPKISELMQLMNEK